MRLTLPARQASGHIDRLLLFAKVGIDATSIAAACVSAFLLRFDFKIVPPYDETVRVALLLWPVTKLVAFITTTVHCRSWRHFTVHDLAPLIAGNALGSGALLLLAQLFHTPAPRSVWVIDFLLCLGLNSAARVGARVVAERNRMPSRQTTRQRTIIYGAGDAGVLLVRQIRSRVLAHEILGFVDDSPQRQGLKIHGVPVLGLGSSLHEIVDEFKIDIVLIATPSATGLQMTRILEHCQRAQIAFKTVPALAKIIENGRLTNLREVALEDLLSRSPVRLEQSRIAARIEERTLMVTGAAGSIGAELCRQIARFRPAAIVAYEIAESPLFQLQQEMARQFPDIRFHAIVGSIQNAARVTEVFREFRPSVVYHAAAYKHVPLMETHSFEAIENNLTGTLNVALAAERFGASDFVLISSDKAVRPSSVMGATKRLAELAIRSMQNGATKFISVRFGNVLGSNGSVVPIFQEQIAAGGPVTVTHPEMRRFFMTIPEACQLVLQASAMGHGGEIFVLDMGEPVRILDLAHKMILLAGLRPGKDIAIKFIGIRPGEKLFEELSESGENNIPTYHEKVKIFDGATLPWQQIEAAIAGLQAACQNRCLEEAVGILQSMIPEYAPSAYLSRRAAAAAKEEQSARAHR